MYHWADLISLIIIAWFVIQGIISGLIVSLFRLVAIVAGTILSARYSSPVFEWLSRQFPAFPEGITKAIAYALVFIAVVVVIQILANILKSLADFALLGWLDKLGGLIVGFIKAALLISLIFWGVSIFPPNSLTDTIKNESVSYHLFMNVAPSAYNSLVKPFVSSKDFQQQVDSITGKFRKELFPQTATPENFMKYIETSGQFNQGELNLLKERYDTLPQAEKERLFDMLKGSNKEMVRAITELLRK